MAEAENIEDSYAAEMRFLNLLMYMVLYVICDVVNSSRVPDVATTAAATDPPMMIPTASTPKQSQQIVYIFLTKLFFKKCEKCWLGTEAESPLIWPVPKVLSPKPIPGPGIRERLQA